MNYPNQVDLDVPIGVQGHHGNVMIIIATLRTIKKCYHISLLEAEKEIKGEVRFWVNSRR